MIRMPVLVLTLSLVIAACGGEDPTVATTGPTATSAPTAASTTTSELTTTSEEATPEPSEVAEPTTPAEPATQTLTLTGDGLPAGDYTVVIDTAAGQQVSTQQLDGDAFTIDLGETPPEDVSTVAVHAGTSATGPALLSGELSDGAGTLTTALPVDLTGASGQYILATPTDGGDSDERSGVWYVIIPRAPGLVLPVLPAEWVYEGWATIDGVHVTTGRFSDPATPDDFAGFSGDQGGPPLPGEDFLLNAPEGTTFPVDLAGMTTFVTIEPAQDASPEPSGLTVLSGQIPADAVDHTIYDLTSTVDALPTLTAQVS